MHLPTHFPTSAIELVELLAFPARVAESITYKHLSAQEHLESTVLSMCTVIIFKEVTKNYSLVDQVNLVLYAAAVFSVVNSVVKLTFDGCNMCLTPRERLRNFVIRLAPLFAAISVYIYGGDRLMTANLTPPCFRYTVPPLSLLTVTPLTLLPLAFKLTFISLFALGVSRMLETNRRAQQEPHMEAGSD